LKAEKQVRQESDITPKYIDKAVQEDASELG